ncbi:hypothetical protein ABNP32_12695 [Pseudomonas viridiflava]
MRVMSGHDSTLHEIFIDRNPKEKAAEHAFLALAQNGYVPIAPDPADKAFEIANKHKLQATNLRPAEDPESDPDDT